MSIIKSILSMKYMFLRSKKKLILLQLKSLELEAYNIIEFDILFSIFN